MNATENQIFVETVSDQELEMLIGGADRGWIKTLT
ncbi:type A2 lanthipeptide, partial [Streptococcus suis]